MSQSVGEFVREKMEKLGITQRELAAKYSERYSVRCEQNYISSWMTGRRRAPGNLVMLLLELETEFENSQREERRSGERRCECGRRETNHCEQPS